MEALPQQAQRQVELRRQYQDEERGLEGQVPASSRSPTSTAMMAVLMVATISSTRAERKATRKTAIVASR